MSEKRSVPLTIWVTPSDSTELEKVLEGLARESRWPLVRPKRAALVYGLLQAGLSHWKANGGALAGPATPSGAERGRRS